MQNSAPSSENAGVSPALGKRPYQKPVLTVSEVAAATQKDALTIETTFAGPS